MWHGYGVKPFDLAKGMTGVGVPWLKSLHQDLTDWLKSDDMRIPKRFVTWHGPSALAPDATLAVLSESGVACGLLAWTDHGIDPTMAGLEARYGMGLTTMEWPETKLDGYVLAGQAMDHLTPKGKRSHAPCWAVLTSRDFRAAPWNFFQPMPNLRLDQVPMVIAVDVEPTDQIFLDEPSCEPWGAAALNEDGVGNWRVTMAIAVGAENLKTLKRRVDSVKQGMARWFALEQEVDEALSKAIQCFGPTVTANIGLSATRRSMTTCELAFLFSPLGYPTLGHDASR